MDSYDISASALTAQRLRMDTISSNLANVNTTRKSDGSLGAYRRKNVVFAPIYDEVLQSGNGFSRITGKSLAGSFPMNPSPQGISLGPNEENLLTARIQYQNTEGTGVAVLEITEDTETPMKLVYDPSHPDANEEGYVELPNVNLVTEMVDMISATRAYEANVTAFQSSKTMEQATLEM